jgi:hypothetical protein
MLFVDAAKMERPAARLGGPSGRPPTQRDDGRGTSIALRNKISGLERAGALDACCRPEA